MLRMGIRSSALRAGGSWAMQNCRVNGRRASGNAFPCGSMGTRELGAAAPGSHAPHGNPFFGAPRRWIVGSAELPRKWTQSVRQRIPMREHGNEGKRFFADASK
ncbi:MAG: hypothetical protein EHM72_13580 [Calditrichaeota bacterium]|nr:MAG: hypothetical protein EHM72_13580 [Calditrichota bacterium]